VNKQNQELWNQLVSDVQRTLILVLRAFLGGLSGGFVTAILANHLAPEAFNLGPQILNTFKLMLGSGLTSAALYLQQNPSSKTPSTSPETK
jgi:hypothetical protein